MASHFKATCSDGSDPFELQTRNRVCTKAGSRPDVGHQRLPLDEAEGSHPWFFNLWHFQPRKRIRKVKIVFIDGVVDDSAQRDEYVLDLFRLILCWKEVGKEVT